MEANALGTPALVAGHGGMAEMVVPGVSGQHYVPRDSESFWKALGTIAQAKDPKALREASRHHAEAHYSKEDFLKNRLSLYEALAA